MAYPTDTLIKIGVRNSSTLGALQGPSDIAQRFEGFLTDVHSSIGLLLMAYGGQRNYTDQWKLRLAHLQGGPRAAAPGGSWHTYGRAIDVVPVWLDGTANWDMNQSGWKRVEDIAEKWGLKTGLSFGDPGHIKYTSGASLVDLRKSNPGWEQYVQLEKKMKKKEKGNPWIKPLIYTSVGLLANYGIFEYNKRRA